MFAHITFLDGIGEFSYSGRNSMHFGIGEYRPSCEYGSYFSSMYLGNIARIKTVVKKRGIEVGFERADAVSNMDKKNGKRLITK